jgi:hypothetical protein
MKQLFYYSFLSLGFFIAACNSSDNSNSKDHEALMKSITDMEDSIMSLQRNPAQANKIPTLTNIELINRLIAFYHAYPKEDYAATCLMKVHIKYSDLNAHEKALAYGDTLLTSFPKFKNRDFIIESMASTYDIMITPRDTAKIRKYYNLLLKEPTITKEKRIDVRARLKHLDMTLFEYIDFQSAPLSK